MKVEFSEFTYGYALTSDLANRLGAFLVGAPIFPSLIEEGVLGYDLSLPMAGSPLFVQFKLSERMIRSSAKGSDFLGNPHYRMRLRPRKRSNQHQLLLDLEASGRAVFYATPRFHTLSELNSLFAATDVGNSSAFFRPQAIGSWNDDEEHFVSFSPTSPSAYRFSRTPHEVQVSELADVERALFKRPATDEPAKNRFEKLGEDLVELWKRAPRLEATVDEAGQRTPGVEDVLVEESEDSKRWLENSIREVKKLGPATFAGWVSQILYGCSLYAPLRWHF